MPGVVLETLSNRKLFIFTLSLLLLQVIFYLIGGLVAPAPYNTLPIMGTKCLDLGNHRHKQTFTYSRGDGACTSVETFDDPELQRQQVNANQIVFTFQFPIPRENYDLKMSRWFQSMVAVIDVDITYDEKDVVDSDAVLTMESSIGYRNEDDYAGNWTELARSRELRPLRCNATVPLPGHPLRCDILPFFELGGVFHQYYIVNIRLPIHDNGSHTTNLGIGHLEDMHLVVIHQNGGFTKVWFAMKTVLFPLVLGCLVWYWRRITMMERNANLLERSLFAVGLAMSFLNLPLEWFSLWTNMYFSALLTDIRQGIFYSVLLCFWVIFAGEHMMDKVQRSRLTYYWKHLSAVAFACICLFIFEMCERGVQLRNPFYSIWSTKAGSNVALAFIVLAGLAAGVYFLFLCYMVYKVFRNISDKKASLPSMNKSRRKFYTGLIFRFRFLMGVTLFCAAMTVIFFILGEVSESEWKWGEKNKLQYSSAFLTGVYGMWNIYVVALMVLYAPSHKSFAAIPAEDEDEDEDEQVEFTSLPPTEGSVLTAFVHKEAED